MKKQLGTPYSKTYCTRSQLANWYGIHPNTLRNWLQRLGLQLPSGLLSPIDQQRIFEALGDPPAIEDSENAQERTSDY